MLASHTPGPWHIADQEIRGRVHPESVGVFERVAVVAPVSRRPAPAGGEAPARLDPDIQQANAQLIAAAPDLLLALQDLEAALSHALERGLLEEAPLDPRTALDAQEWMRGHLQQPVRHARAAVAKALGRGR